MDFYFDAMDVYTISPQLDSSGLGIIKEKPRFLCHNALPGECVEVCHIGRKKQHHHVLATRVMNPHSTRCEPICQHTKHCGGCSLQHMNQQAQLAFKQDDLIRLLEEHGLKVNPFIMDKPIEGASIGYRQSARISMRWDTKRQRLLMGFREKKSNFITDMKHCPILDSRLNAAFLQLKSLLGKTHIRQHIPQCQAIASQEGITLIIRHLKPFLPQDVEHLQAFATTNNYHIIAHGDAHVSFGRQPRHFYTIGDLQIHFDHRHFVQVNQRVNIKMINKAIELLDPQSHEHALDLFCGIGNFTLPIAQHVRSIVGVEANNTAINQAKINAKLNHLDKQCTFYCQDLFTYPLVADHSTVDIMLIDPPRSGARSLCENLEAYCQLKRMVYISCNRASFAADAAVICSKGFDLIHLSMIDMFTHTAQSESIALFVRR